MSPIKPSQQIAKLQVGTNPPDAYTQFLHLLSGNGDMLAQAQQKESFVEQDGTPHTVYTHVFTTHGCSMYEVSTSPHYDPLSCVEGTLVEEKEVENEEGTVYDGTPE